MMEKLKKIVAYKWFDYGVVFVTAVVFGFFRLDAQSIWNDESISIHFAKWPLVAIWDYVPKHDLHPPLYYSIIHYWQQIFGGSIFSYRGFSALCFVGSALLLYYFANLIFQKKSIALAVAVIFISNPFAVLYAQEVRSYSLLLFAIILNSIFFYKINPALSGRESDSTGKCGINYEENKNRYFYLGYFATALIFIYTNILSLFVLATHFLIVLYLRNWQKSKVFVGIYAGLFVLFLPALRLLKNANDYDYSYYYPERFNIFLKTIVVFSGFIGARINILNGKFHIYGLLGASLFFYGLLFVLLIYHYRKINRFLLSFFTICFIFLITVAHIKFPVPDPKYFYPIFPFFILLLGGILVLLKRRWQFWLVLVGVLGFNLIFLYNYHFVKRFEKENWKSVVAMIEADYLNEKSKSAVSISCVAEPHSTWTYYSKNIIPAYGGIKYGNSTSTVYQSMDEALGSGKDIVYLSRFICNLYDPGDIIRVYLEDKGYQKTKEIKDTKVEYWRYDRIKR